MPSCSPRVRRRVACAASFCTSCSASLHRVRRVVLRSSRMWLRLRASHVLQLALLCALCVLRSRRLAYALHRALRVAYGSCVHQLVYRFSAQTPAVATTSSVARAALPAPRTL